MKVIFRRRWKENQHLTFFMPRTFPGPLWPWDTVNIKYQIWYFSNLLFSVCQLDWRGIYGLQVNRIKKKKNQKIKRLFRLFTNTGELICLQTRGFLEYNKATKKIESFLCINTLIREQDQEKYLSEQKERFTPYISELQNASSMVIFSLSLHPVDHQSNIALQKSLLSDPTQQKELKSAQISVISKVSHSGIKSTVRIKFH